MGRPFGIPVYVSPSWFIVAVVVTVMFERPGRPSTSAGPLRLPRRPRRTPSCCSPRCSCTRSATAVVARALRPARTRHHPAHPRRRHRDRRASRSTPGREFARRRRGPAAVPAPRRRRLRDARPGAAPWRGRPAHRGRSPSPTSSSPSSTCCPASRSTAAGSLRAAVWKLTGDSAPRTVAAGWAGRGVAVVVVLVLGAALSATGGGDRSADGHAGPRSSPRSSGSAPREAIRVARIREPHARCSSARRLARRAIRSPPEHAARRGRTPRAGGRRAAPSSSSTTTADPVGIVSETAVIATPEHRRPWVDAVAADPRARPRA